VEGIEFLRAHEQAALFDEPGLGKSRQALEAAEEPAVVVAPAMVIASGVWDDEIAKWTPGMDVTQVPYSSLSSRERTEKGGTRPTGKLHPDYRRKYRTAILDEAHYIKGRNTNWTLAIRELEYERITMMTGTPLPNWAHEAYTILRLLFPEEAKAGQRLGSYWRWAAEWFDVEPKVDRKGNLLTSHAVGDFRSDRTWDEFVDDTWRDRMLRRLRKDCLDLPPLTEMWMRVDMGPAQKKAYGQLKRDFITWLESGVEVAAWSNAGQMVKLCQCATGLEVLEPEAKGSAKLDLMRDLLKDREMPTLVVAHFRSSVAAAFRTAREAGKQTRTITGGTSLKERARVVRAFQAGELDVLCATIDTISEGLTLNAADQVILLERSWRPSRNEQVIRRIHRIGQDKPVSAINLVTRKTVDERVLELLAEKSDSQMLALGERDLRLAA